VFLQQYLKARKIPYIFSTADYNAIDYNIIKLLGTEHINLWKAIDFDPWFYWESYNKKVGFLNWANHCQLPTGKHGHPLEQAHCLTFEMIKNKVALS
jgi:hypothetical protein